MVEVGLARFRLSHTPSYDGRFASSASRRRQRKWMKNLASKLLSNNPAVRVCGADMLRPKAEPNGTLNQSIKEFL